MIRRLESTGLLLLAAVLACGGGDSSDAAAPAAVGGFGTAQVDAAELLKGSWMRAAAQDPDAVNALLDASGGSGWLDLFHGDLATAKATFEAGHSASARLGLARVHLGRAATLSAGARLHREAALDLIRYRRDHRDAVRTGGDEYVLAALTAQRCGASGDELAAFVAAAAQPPPRPVWDDRHRALQELLREGAISTVFLRYADRLAFASAMEQGLVREPAAVELLARANSGKPDMVDDLGSDDEAGIQFKLPWYDCAILPSLARYHLGEAWIVGSALQGPGPAIAAAVEGAWGGPIPEALRTAPEPPPEGAALPPWTALFAGPAVDREDWDVLWGGPGTSFADRFGGPSGADAALAAVADAEALFVDALKAGAPEAGALLVDELSLAVPAMDRVLRSRMIAAIGAGDTPASRVLCKRYGDRSVDPNPGSRGGSPDSARTRVSWRNDRAFLLHYARCLWRAGQPGGALDFVHPLATEDPALQSVKHYLGQLDSAASIGLQGKTSQL